MGKEKWKIKNREKRCEVLQTASVGPAVLYLGAPHGPVTGFIIVVQLDVLAPLCIQF